MELQPFFLIMKKLYNNGLIYTEKLLKDQAVQKLLQPPSYFDLVIVEQFFNEAHMAFAHHFKAPLIVFSPVGLSEWTSELLGNPHSFSVNPMVCSPYSDGMHFKQRVYNTIYGMFDKIYKHAVALPAQNGIMKMYFPDAPVLSQVMYTASMVLLFSSHGLSPAVPLLPNMIEIGGYHISPPNVLPSELQTFLDKASNGAIYFSMGSKINSRDSSSKLSNDILKCLSSLNLHVLWKWKTSAKLPKNVKIGDWFPQLDVLAHPNIRLFITHGGFISITEAIHHAVPIIGIPIFADQKSNMEVAVSKGYGLKIPLENLSQKLLCEAINEVLTNSTQKAHKWSRIMKDEPIKPAKKAIFWIEHVIKNKGAPHLRSAALNLNWLQYYLVDVFCCLVFISLVSVFVLIALCKVYVATTKVQKSD